MAGAFDTLARLPEEFRTRAASLDAYAPAAARAFRDAAESVERAIRDAEGEQLTLQEAAVASGYSADHLSRLIASGRLRNVGRKHAPRVLRGELPRKPARAAPRPQPGAVTAEPAAVDVMSLTRAFGARAAGRPSAAYRGRRPA